LKGLLTKRNVSYLNPDDEKSQFQRSRSFMDGLAQASDAWRTKFKVTARGLRRPYWVEPVEALKDVCTRFLLALLCTTGCPVIPPENRRQIV